MKNSLLSLQLKIVAGYISLVLLFPVVLYPDYRERITGIINLMGDRLFHFFFRLSA